MLWNLHCTALGRHRVKPPPAGQNTHCAEYCKDGERQTRQRLSPVAQADGLPLKQRAEKTAQTCPEQQSHTPVGPDAAHRKHSQQRASQQLQGQKHAKFRRLPQRQEQIPEDTQKIKPQMIPPPCHRPQPSGKPEEQQNQQQKAAGQASVSKERQVLRLKPLLFRNYTS